jgi:hypothetical protein
LASSCSREYRWVSIKRRKAVSVRVRWGVYRKDFIGPSLVSIEFFFGIKSVSLDGIISKKSRE